MPLRLPPPHHSTPHRTCLANDLPNASRVMIRTRLPPTIPYSISDGTAPAGQSVSSTPFTARPGTCPNYLRLQTGLMMARQYSLSTVDGLTGHGSSPMVLSRYLAIIDTGQSTTAMHYFLCHKSFRYHNYLQACIVMSPMHHRRDYAIREASTGRGWEFRAPTNSIQ